MKNILHIIFLFGDWDIDPRKHLYKEVLKQTGLWSTTLIVQQPICLLGHLIWRFKQKIIGLIFGKYKTQQLDSTTILFTPIILFNYSLWFKHSLIAQIDSYFLNKQLKKFVQMHFPKHRVVLWVFIPELYYITQKLHFDYLVYDLQDNVEYHPDDGSLKPLSKDINERLIKTSDLVICTSTILFSKSSKINSNSILIQNGNEFKVLTENSTLEFKNELSGIDKPIIGYLGGIRHWLDFELLKFLIENIPNVYFVFIGILYRNAKDDFQNLLNFPNVIWIKYKEQHLLPGYLKKFSVGLIPFKINKFTEAVFPNKFFEYMALEVPIVTTALPDLKMYSNIIGYSYNPEEIILNCKAILNGEYEGKIKNYKQIAALNSWENRASEINKHLLKLISEH